MQTTGPHHDHDHAHDHGHGHGHSHGLVDRSIMRSREGVRAPGDGAPARPTEDALAAVGPAEPSEACCCPHAGDQQALSKQANASARGAARSIKTSIFRSSRPMVNDRGA